MEKDRLYEMVLNSISEGVMTVNRDWKIVSWNNAAERITGYHSEEVVGKECMDVFRASLCRNRCPVDRALTCGHPCQDIEVAVHNKKNQVIHLVVNAAPLYDESGHIVGGLETFRDVSQNHWLQKELQQQMGYGEIVGQSEAMQRVFDLLASLINEDTTVLIQGESGTGKELIARALHFYGPRREKSFVAINCSAIPEGMLESELFGHAKGAFTGAVQPHVGKFETANGGTLFLDEIAEISHSVQIKLLRVLEEREFQRLGDNRSLKIDIRLVTASNQNLYKKVLDGSFREDLYYRLSVFPLELPPLRERIEDIPLLVDHFITKFNNQMGKKIHGIADGVLDILEAYSWPGNIRELANAIEHAFVHTKGVLIHPTNLPQSLLTAAKAVRSLKSSSPRDAMDLFEKELIVQELEEADWRKSVAARRLGMSRATLWRKMGKYGIRK